jgi:hypothetical protein
VHIVSKNQRNVVAFFSVAERTLYGISCPNGDALTPGPAYPDVDWTNLFTVLLNVPAHPLQQRMSRRGKHSDVRVLSTHDQGAGSTGER